MRAVPGLLLLTWAVVLAARSVAAGDGGVPTAATGSLAGRDLGEVRGRRRRGWRRRRRRLDEAAHLSVGEEGVLCWDIEGPFERDCFHDEPLTWEPYPLLPEMLERAVPYEASDVSVHRAFQRARDRGVLKVVVVGGSVTYGHQCASPAGLRDQDCAWPHRLEQWFAANVGDFDVEVTNTAVPGSGVIQFLHKAIGEALAVDLEVDLVIVDFGVNDAVIERVDFNLEYIRMAHEILIRHARNDMSSSPALIYAEGYIPPSHVVNTPWQSENMAEVHAEVTQKYDIPMVSFRHAVWPDKDDTALADEIWGTEVHPDWQVHQLMADLLVHYLQKSYARFLEAYGPVSEPTPVEEAYWRFRSEMGCVATPPSYAVEFGEYMDQPPPPELVSATGWSFLNLHRTPGLTGFGNSSSSSEASAVATFELPCAGPKRILDVEYLVSYEGMGAIKVTVDPAPQLPHHDGEGGDRVADGEGSGGGGGSESSAASVTFVDGLWGSHASVPWFETISIAEAPEGGDPADGTVRVVFEILSADTERLYDPTALFLDAGEDENAEGKNVRGDRKFKLLSLHCC